MFTTQCRSINRQLWPALVAWLLAFPLLVVPTAAQTITAGTVCGLPGTSVWVDVSFDPAGKSISGTQNDITFDSNHTPIGTCVVNDQVGKNLAWSFLPDGCSGSACNRIRATIIAFGDDPLTNSSTGPMLSPIVLYRCRVDIPAGTPVETAHWLAIGSVSGSDPLGNAKAVTGVGSLFYVRASCSGC